MTRQKIQIKKIDNHNEVTILKGRRGLFKIALELSILCDAEIGLFCSLLLASSLNTPAQGLSLSFSSLTSKHHIDEVYYYFNFWLLCS